MSSRWWVGGSGNWSDDDNHWATESGGSPGDGNLLTSSDDVFFDANSGFGSGGTINPNGVPRCYCRNFTSTTGHSYSISNNGALELSGSATFESGITFGSATTVILNAGTSDNTITLNGVSLADLSIFGSGSWVLQDNLVCTGEFYQDDGTFDANDFGVTAGDFYFAAYSGKAPVVYMGNGTWEATSESGEQFTFDESQEVYLQVYAEGSTMKISSGGVYGFFYFESSNSTVGHTFNNLWIDGEWTGYYQIYGSNTFNQLKITAPNIIEFEGGSTTTISELVAVGSSGDVITLDRISGSAFTLSKVRGIVECDYLDLTYSNATGGALWYAGDNSVDSGNNSGWTFTDRKDPLPGMRR